MKRQFLVALTVLSASALFGAAITPTVNYWQAVDGDWSGSWDDSDHWSNGAIGEGQKGRFDLKKNQPIEVTYPSGVYTNAGEIFARGWDNRWSFQLVGTNTTYTMGGSADGTDIHSAAPFSIVQGNYPGYFATSYTGPYSAAPIVMSNFLFSAVSADEGLNILFDGGLYDMPKCNVSFFVGDPGGMPGDRIVRIQDATMNASSFKIAVTKAKGLPGISRVVLDNSTVNSSGRFIFPESSDGCDSWADKNTFEFIIDNGSSFTFSGTGLGGCTKEGPLTNKLQLVTVDHGSSFVQSGDPADFNASQGHYVFSILNGSTAKFGNRSIYFGSTGYGVTDVIFSNAVHDIKGTYYFGPRNSVTDPSSAYYDTARANLIVYNGAITNKSNGLRFTSAGLKLVDSLFVGRPVGVQAADAATARLHANGATMRFTTADGLTSDILYGFDEATVGARGLVVENQYVASPLSQDFADAPDEKGVVTFAGTKDYTLNSTDTTVSTVAVAGVTATFADTARFASTLVVTNGAKVVNVPTAGLKGLVLGTAGTTGAIELDYTKTVDVAGELVLVNPVFTAANLPTKDVTHVVFRAQAASDATRQAWKKAALNVVPVAGCGLLCETREAAQGGIEFCVTMREAITHEETLTTATTEERSAEISVSSIDTVKATVVSGGELTLSGEIGEGRFEKWGEGRTVLSNPNNLFVGGVALYEGALGVTSVGALGYANNNAKTELRGGALDLMLDDGSTPVPNPLELTASTVSNAIVIRATKEATIRPWTATAGAVLKTGPATLTVAATADAALTASDGRHVNSRGTQLRSEEPLVFTEAGAWADGAYAGLTVVEGNMLLKGPTDVTLRSQYTVAVGAPTTDVSAEAQPAGLTVDGLTFDNYKNASPRGMALATGMTYGDNTPTAMCSPYIVATNGATIKVPNMFIGNGSGVSDTTCHPRPRFAAVDHSTIDIASYLYANSVASSNFVPQVEALDKSFLLVGSASSGDPLYIGNSVDFTIDDSVLAKKSDLTPLIVTLGNGWAATTVNFRFRNGAKFCCNSFTYPGTTHAGRINLFFDDAAWLPGCADYDFTPANTGARVEVSGRGVILAPPADGEYRWLFETTGAGGLVKEGEGLLVLNVTNAMYTGSTAVNAGTLDLDGSVWTRRTFGGTGGALANGALEYCTVANTNLTYASTLQVSGRLAIDLGGEGRSGETRVVGHYEGTEPDLSRWRVTNGAEPYLKATFAAEDGDITATLVCKGLMLIVR